MEYLELHRNDLHQVKVTLATTRKAEGELHQGYSHQNSQERQHYNTSKVRESKSKFAIRIRPPYWLQFLCRSWELLGKCEESVWMFTLRAYYTIPFDSPIIQYIQQGDIINVQKLLKERQTSPSDRDPDGFTILDVSQHK
jgi:hypothetical protein